MKRNVKFLFTDPKSLMVQSALSAHTVITWGGGPALVMGFEGKPENDGTRRKQLLQYYSTAISIERRKVLLQIHSDVDIASILKVEENRFFRTY